VCCVLVLAGNAIKKISPRLYEKFREFQQSNRLKWFEGIALDDNKSLHAASGWGYLTIDQYNEIVDDVLKNIPIRKCSILETFLQCTVNDNTTSANSVGQALPCRIGLKV